MIGLRHKATACIGAPEGPARYDIALTYGSCLDLLKMFDRITRDPSQMNGQPCIRGMRLTVRRVLEAVATYPNRDELFREYPELEEEDIRQALEFASANLDDTVIELPMP